MFCSLFTLFISSCPQIYNSNTIHESLKGVHYEQPLSAKEKELIIHVQQSIALAEEGSSKIIPEILEVQGMSSAKVRHFLNNLCAMPHTNYLEIGCWFGSTWIAAMYENHHSIVSATAIDDWSQFGGTREIFARNCDKFLKNSAYQLFCEDCFKINLRSFTHPINIYFYDGDHSFHSQEMAFTYFNSLFDDLFIAVVDDWNWGQVGEGTYSAFSKLHYEVLFETALPARWNCDTENWWNGLYVAVIRKAH